MAKAGKNDVLGHDGFIWWVGTVENRMDPLNVGRCQVRILGLHSSNKMLIPTENLPWAQPLYPNNNSNSTPSTLKEGDMVMGFFMDGAAGQYPIIMGMFQGIPETVPNSQDGFNDQRTEEQLKTSPRKVQSIDFKSDGTGAVITDNTSGTSYPNRINEPTTSRLSRNENIDHTIVKSKKDSIVKDIPDTTDNGKWSEPTTPYNAKYPYNQVISTESGHYFEMDDTPGAERIHLYHRSGTFSETYPDGTQVDKIVKDKYSIIMKDDNVYIMGSCKVTVQGNAQVYVKENCDLKVDGDLNFKVKGNWNNTVQGDTNITTKNFNVNSSGTSKLTSSGDTTIKASNIRLN